MDSVTHTSDSSVNDDIGAGVVQVNSSDSRRIYGQSTGHTSDQMQNTNIRAEHAGETVGIAETLKSMRTIGSSLTIDPFGNGNCESPGAGSGPGSAGSAVGHAQGHGADHMKPAGASKRRDSFGSGHPPTHAYNSSGGGGGASGDNGAAAAKGRNVAAATARPAAVGASSELDEYSYSKLDTSGDFGK